MKLVFKISIGVVALVLFLILDLLKLQEDFESKVPAKGNVQNTENLDQNTSEENNTAE